MPKTAFQLVYVVLEELYAEIRAELGSEGAADEAVHSRIEKLSQDYAKLTDSNLPPIDYSSPITRFAYLYTNVTAHADFVYQALGETQPMFAADLLAKEHIVVACLGGGPGSELVGFLRYLIECSSKIKTVTCYLCDREQAWADSWTELGQKLDGGRPIFVNFQPLDVTEPSSWSKQKKFLSADLFISSYFASEVMRVGEKTMDFWKAVQGAAKPGARLLVVDNDSQHFDGYLQQITTDLGWKQEYGKKGRRTLSYTEQKQDLHGFLTKFKNRLPRLQASVDVRLFRKA